MSRIIIFIFCFLVADLSYGQKTQLVTPSRENEEFYSVLSPNGLFLLTRGATNYVSLWEVYSGKLIRKLDGHRNWVEDAVFSPDGTKIMTISLDSTARVYNTATGDLIYTLVGHEDRVVSASFSADGRRIMTASNSIVRLWDVASGSLVKRLSAGCKLINHAIIHPDCQRIIISGASPYVRVYDLSTGKEIALFSGHSSWINSMSISPNGSKLLTSDGATIRIWDLNTGELLVNFECRIFCSFYDWSHTSKATFSPDGEIILTASDENSAHLWDASTGRLINTLNGHLDELMGAAFSSNGDRILTYSRDNTARVWSAESGVLLNTLTANGTIYSGIFIASDSRLITTSEDGALRIWSSANGLLLQELKGSAKWVHVCTFSPNGKFLATASYDEPFTRLWNIQTGCFTQKYDTKSRHVDRIDFSENGDYLVTASRNKSARIFEVASGKETQVLTDDNDGVVSVAFSPDRNCVLTCLDSSAVMWDIKTGRKKFHLSGHRAKVNSAVFNLNGDKIVTSSEDDTAILWDALSAKKLLTLEGHSANVSWAAFSPFGERILTSSWDSTLRIWDGVNGSLLFQFKSHDSILSANYSHDGKEILIVSGSDAIVLQGDNLNELHRLYGHCAMVHSADFDPTGKYIVTTGYDNKTLLWDAKTGELLYTRLQLEGDDWLIHDDEGHFDGTENAINQLYFACGLEIIENIQLRNMLWVPGLAGKILANNSIGADAQISPSLSDYELCGLSPIAERLDYGVNSPLTYRIRPGLAGMGRTELYVKGVLLCEIDSEDLKRVTENGSVTYYLNVSEYLSHLGLMDKLKDKDEILIRVSASEEANFRPIKVLSNVIARQSGQLLLISYILSSCENRDIGFCVSTDGGETWIVPIKGTSGDLGFSIEPGDKLIKWEVLKDFDQFCGDEIMFRVFTK